MNKELLYEENIYIEQYHNAVFKLMDGENIDKYLYPIINLIHQTIENELKYLIAESVYDEETYKDLKIGNTHNLLELVENERLKKYYDEIEDYEKIFADCKKAVIFFHNILGDNTFLNSRYSIKTISNEVTEKKEVNKDELYNMWGSYCDAYSKIYLMYVAYSFSNTVFYMKNILKKEDEEIEMMKIAMVNEIKQDKEDIFDVTVYLLMDKYIKRNKYVDYKYVN